MLYDPNNFGGGVTQYTSTNCGAALAPLPGLRRPCPDHYNHDSWCTEVKQCQGMGMLVFTTIIEYDGVYNTECYELVSPHSFFNNTLLEFDNPLYSDRGPVTFTENELVNLLMKNFLHSLK